MKKYFLKFLSLVLVIIFIGMHQFNVFAATDSATSGDASIDTSDISLEVDDSETFDDCVANDSTYIDLVIAAAQKKGRDISLEGVHPDKNIKLYGFKNSENVLQSLCDYYLENGNIEKTISNDFAILKLYTNKEKEYVDSLVFIKKENLPTAQEKNGWVQFCSGSMVISDEILVEYADLNNLNKFLKELGLKNAKKVKMISGIPTMPVSIYFIQKDVEFLIPLEDTGNMTALQAYKVSDVFENYLLPTLDYQSQKAEEYKDLEIYDIPMGESPIPENLPSIVPIDMNKFSSENTVSIANNKFDVLYFIVPIIFVILTISSFLIYRKKSKNNILSDNKLANVEENTKT